jgi:hypothetical protein
VIDADLALPPEALSPDGGTAEAGTIVPAVVLIDGDGRLHRVRGQEMPAAGEGLRLEMPLTVAVGDGSATATGPLRLEAIELEVSAPVFSVVEGTLTLRDVEVSDEADGPSWTTVGLDPGDPDWSWTRLDPLGESGPIHPPSETPGTITIGGEGSTTGSIFRSPTDAGVVLRLRAAHDEPAALPAIVGTAFLAASGAKVGDTLAAQTYGRSILLEVVGAVDAFPPLDPEIPFVVVDRPTLELTRFAEDGQVAAAGEWWLALDASRAEQALAALRGAPFASTSIVERAELTRAMETDPVPLGVIGALGIGALAAMAFASIGFVVSATASTSERLGEFALLQALGLSKRELSAWLSLEHAFLLAAGLLAGTLLGLMLAWLVLPFATLSESGAATVPPAVVVIPWEAILPLYLVAVGLLVVTVLLVTRGLSRIPLSGVLRARDG